MVKDGERTNAVESLVGKDVFGEDRFGSEPDMTVQEASWAWAGGEAVFWHPSEEDRFLPGRVFFRVFHPGVGVEEFVGDGPEPVVVVELSFGQRFQPVPVGSSGQGVATAEALVAEGR
ncbi:hypothetical protein [Nesterenkonia populi]|uniref:hypothetical protein n=1 Tax=Nesterenkonia populi TaxID=1591087 RepID=UPI001FE4345A|nr:hypothetical protein [Nesterenkonia populi]